VGKCFIENSVPFDFPRFIRVYSRLPPALSRFRIRIEKCFVVPALFPSLPSVQDPAFSIPPIRNPWLKIPFFCVILRDLWANVLFKIPLSLIFVFFCGNSQSSLRLRVFTAFQPKFGI
jgi:hypothetical protein